MFYKLYDSTNSFFRILLPNLLKIVRHIVRGQAAVAHDEVVGLLAGDFGDGGFVYIGVEAGHEVAIGDAPHGFACQFLLLNLGRKLDAEFYHGLEEQVFLRAIGLDIVLEEQVLVELLGRVIDILHVGAVEFQHAEADIEFGRQLGQLWTTFFFIKQGWI